MHKYLVIIERSMTGYSAYVPDLPGCMATGESKELVETNIYEAVKFHIAGLKEEGMEIPKPSSEGETFVFAA